MIEENSLINQKSFTMQKLCLRNLPPEGIAMLKMIFTFICFYGLSQWLISAVSLAFMGRFGQKQFNACSLAFSIYSVIGNCIMIGINYGSDTLLPQCYGGNKRKMGIILQRAIIMICYTSLIVWSILLNMVKTLFFGIIVIHFELCLF